MDGLCSNRKKSNKTKEIMVSEKNEKSLRDWKLPPFPATYAFQPSCCCSLTSRVKTVEKKISLREGFTTIPLLSVYRRIAYYMWYDYLEVGMIQVGLKPKKLGSNTSAIMCVRDKRCPKYHDSIVGMAESSLCDGPIYFLCVPDRFLEFSDTCDVFNIDVKIEGSSMSHGGDRNVTLVYRFHYKLLADRISFRRPEPVDEKEKTTLYLTNIAHGNRMVSKTVSWAESKVSEGLIIANKLFSGGGVGEANVDWKETVKAHVLKVDVPGFKKEEVRVEVEDGGIVQISGERSNEDEEESEKLHCKERSNGKFLRRLRLPENANLEGLEAGLENGLLTVTVPKKKQEVKIVDVKEITSEN